MTDDPNRHVPPQTEPGLQPTPGSAEAPATVRNTTEARQGATPGKGRYVLVIGTLVVIVVLFLAYLGTRP